MEGVMASRLPVLFYSYGVGRGDWAKHPLLRLEIEKSL